MRNGPVKEAFVAAVRFLDLLPHMNNGVRDKHLAVSAIEELMNECDKKGEANLVTIYLCLREIELRSDFTSVHDPLELSTHWRSTSEKVLDDIEQVDIPRTNASHMRICANVCMEALVELNDRSEGSESTHDQLVALLNEALQHGSKTALTNTLAFNGDMGLNISGDSFSVVKLERALSQLAEMGEQDSEGLQRLVESLLR